MTGKVIEQSTGFPLVGGSVSLLLPDGTIAVDQTLNDGSYSFSGLTPGEYTVMLPDGSHRQSFAVVDASSHFAINFELPFGTLSGRVLMPDGSTGDPNALVLLMQGGQVVDRTSNAAEGLYGFQLIAPGTYDLAFVDPNLTFPELTGIVIQAGENTVVPDALPGTSRLQLSVRDAANQVPGGTGFVVIRSADIPDDESLVQTIPIPSNGDVTVSNLAPGNYVVEATYGSEDSGQLEIALPAAGLTQSMTVLPTGTIAGTIASFGSAVSGLTISAYNPSTPTLVDQTTSDDQGSYSLGLAPGTYTVVVSDLRTSVIGPPFGLVTITGLTVSAGGTVTENVTPPLADIAISGQVSDNQGDIPSAGTVTALNADGAVVLTVPIDFGGGFAFSGLSAGSYTLVGAANGFLIAPQSVTVADDDDISNITLSGQWVVDPGGGQGFLTSVVVGFNRSITSLVRGLRSALGEPAPAPDLTRGSLTQPEKLENCPCALAYWNEALFLQDLAHQKFDQIRRQFESNVDTNSLNLGKFGVDLGILAAQLALAGAAANSTKALGEADADFTQAVNQLNAGKLTPADFALTSQRLSQAFELAKAGAGADAIKSFVLGGFVPTVYQATVTKLQTNMNWLEAMANDVKSFSSALEHGRIS